VLSHKNGPTTEFVRQSTCTPSVDIELMEYSEMPKDVAGAVEMLASEGKIARQELANGRFLLVETRETTDEDKHTFVDRQRVQVLTRAGDKTTLCKVDLEDGTATTDWKPLVAQAIDICASVKLK
jgi:hypothetical protein